VPFAYGLCRQASAVVKSFCIIPAECFTGVGGQGAGLTEGPGHPRLVEGVSLTSDKFAGVGNFPTGCGTNLARLDSADGRGMSVESHELHLIGLAIGINMNHRPDIPRLKTVHRHGLGQNYPVMFFDHGCNYITTGRR
jgi:hypothetical protein